MRDSDSIGKLKVKSIFGYALALGCCSLVAASPCERLTAADEWPQWRGPDGQGHATATNLPTEWSDSENLAWKSPLPGRGWSSPVVSGNQIWLTTAVETPATPEELEKLKELPGGQPLNVSGSVSLHAICLDWQTGELLHDIELMVEEDPQPIHSLNSYASPSPTLEAGKLYCHFGSHGTACLDTQTGKVLWTQCGIRINHENGPGATPVLYQDYLIVHCDGSDEQSVVALQKQTGEIAWQTPRSGKLNENPQLKKAYGTPLLVEQQGKTQLISPGADWLYGYDPKTGEELWRLNYGMLGFSIVPRPVYDDGIVYFSTSFMQPQLLAVDISQPEPQIVWKYSKQAPTMPSPLLVGAELYMVSERGIMTCLNAKSGEAYWTERLGGNFSSSPLFADGRIFVGNRDGEMYVLQPGKEFKQLAANPMDGAIMASPIALRDSLVVRTENSLYRIRKD